MEESENRAMKRTYSLVVDDLKQYRESHKILNDINEIIVRKLDMIREHVMEYRSVQKYYSSMRRW